MSKLTLDEAIRHCEEVAWENDRKAMCVEEAYQTTERQNCEQCAADQRELAAWLTDYKELKNSLGAVKLSDMKDALALIRTLKTELYEAKRLLKLAIEDIDNARHGINCGICGMPKNDIDVEKRCEVDNVQPECKYRWQYADEALKLLGEDTNG